MDGADAAHVETVRLDADEWHYSSEGNAKMTFTYSGADPRLHGWVLQLDKRSTDAGALSSAAAAARETELRRKLDAAQFVDSVIGPLIGQQYVLPRRLVRAPPQFLDQLSAAAAELRPPHRAPTQIDPEQQCLVLTRSMLTRGDPARRPGVHAVTVELKPKWGFLPQSALISPASRVKSQTCRYCMHQHLKHGADGTSALCPLDLFSESRERVTHALDCLAQSPQNNLRVFVDGIQVDDFDSQVPRWADFRRALVDILLAERFLPQLGRLQQRLDPLDIEGLYPAYERALTSGALSNEEPTIAEWLQAGANFQRRDSSDASPDDKQAVLEFVLSTVLKDISVMIAIGSWPSEATATGTPSEYQIAVVDTEPKKVAKMPRHLERSQAIVAKYLELHPDPTQWRACHE